MSRWEPDARGRLLDAAVELFSERGYDATTTAQIADRAGLTKTTLFRYFVDKREILFQGQEALVALADEGIRASPEGSTPMQILHRGVLELCKVHTADRREIGRRLDAILSSSSELRERAVFKRYAIADALYQALAARLSDSRQAAVLAELGVRAYYDGFAAWIASSADHALADVVSNELEGFEAALVALTSKALEATTSAQ